jgi:hypothetical protein
MIQFGQYALPGIVLIIAIMACKNNQKETQKAQQKSDMFPEKVIPISILSQMNSEPKREKPYFLMKLIQ